MEIEVGRIIRSSTTRFSVGCQVLRPQVPVFGSLVKVGVLGDDEIYGLIDNVRMYFTTDAENEKLLQKADVFLDRMSAGDPD